MTGTPIRVLLIEDQLDIQMILKITLEKSGHFSVITAETGQTGIEKADQAKPDFIVLDFSLPDMDGPDVMAKLKADAATSDIPIVMLTARTSGAATEEVKRNGAVDVLFKPFDPRTISEQLLKLYQSTKG